MELAEFEPRSPGVVTAVDLPDASSCYEVDICSLSYKVHCLSLKQDAPLWNALSSNVSDINPNIGVVALGAVFSDIESKASLTLIAQHPQYQLCLD